jgi:sterol desaturase/sphingolipid hydroxylase (fatty acid hydroxylase superfamily)
MLAHLVIEPVKALLLAAMVFIPFERLATANRAQRVFRAGWATDALTGFLNVLLLYIVLLGALAGIDAVASIVAPQLRAWVATQPIAAQAIVAVAIGDLGVYGVHRLQHTVPWLWRFHAVHHSAREMDWLIALRFHAVDLLLSRIASLGLLVALNIAPAAIAVFVAVFAWQSWLAHANVRIRYGPLRWVLVSPEFHHWHHSVEREAYNKNYANVLACWDVVFGTAYFPSGRTPDRFGVDEDVPADFAARFFFPFRRRLDQARAGK